MESKYDYVVFDIETTGLHPESDQICEIVELLCPHVVCVRDDIDGKSRAALSFGVITEYDNEFVVIDEWEDGVLVSREGRYGELNRLGTTFTLSREEYERFCSPVRD